MTTKDDDATRLAIEIKCFKYLHSSWLNMGVQRLNNSLNFIYLIALPFNLVMLKERKKAIQCTAVLQTDDHSSIAAAAAITQTTTRRKRASILSSFFNSTIPQSHHAVMCYSVRNNNQGDKFRDKGNQFLQEIPYNAN